VASGEPFRQDQLDWLNRSRLLAERQTGMAFHIRLGAVSGDPKAAAERLLADLVRPGHAAAGQVYPPDRAAAGSRGGPAAVLILVSPGQRLVRIATTPAARSRISDTAASLATLSMTSSFAVGDLVGGLTAGLRQLADAAGPLTRPPVVSVQ
jgi:hypothetical protein